MHSGTAHTGYKVIYNLAAPFYGDHAHQAADFQICADPISFNR